MQSNTPIGAPAKTPFIPADEYPQRWQRVQTLMVERDLDLLIAYADDRTTYGPAHARWLTDFPVMFEPVCVLLRQSGEPILLCGPESDEYARMRSRVADVRVMQEFTHPDEDYPYSKIQSMSEILGETLGNPAQIRRVGVAGRSLMNADLDAALASRALDMASLDIEDRVAEARDAGRKSLLLLVRRAGDPRFVALSLE